MICGVDVNADERFPGYRFPAAIIGEVVWLRYRFNLSLRDIPALLARSGIVLSHETGVEEHRTRYRQQAVALDSGQDRTSWHEKLFLGNVGLQEPGLAELASPRA